MKSQVSLYLIMGVILVLIVSTFIFLRVSTSRNSFIGDIETALDFSNYRGSVELYVESCLEATTLRGIENYGLKGSESLIEGYVDYNLPYCLEDFKILKQQGYEISFERPSSDIIISGDIVNVDLYFPVTVLVEGEEVLIENYDYKLRTAVSLKTKNGFLKAGTTLYSEDEDVFIFAEQDTTVTKDGRAVNEISLKVMDNNFDNLENDVVIGAVAYEGIPSGAVFSPPLQVTIRLKKADLPNRYLPENPKIGWYDRVTGIWRTFPAMPFKEDANYYYYSALVDHFTPIGIVACGQTGADGGPFTYEIPMERVFENLIEPATSGIWVEDDNSGSHLVPEFMGISSCESRGELMHYNAQDDLSQAPADLCEKNKEQTGLFRDWDEDDVGTESPSWKYRFYVYDEVPDSDGYNGPDTIFTEEFSEFRNKDSLVPHASMSIRKLPSLDNCYEACKLKAEKDLEWYFNPDAEKSYSVDDPVFKPISDFDGIKKSAVALPKLYEYQSGDWIGDSIASLDCIYKFVSSEMKVEYTEEVDDGSGNIETVPGTKTNTVGYQETQPEPTSIIPQEATMTGWKIVYELDNSEDKIECVVKDENNNILKRQDIDAEAEDIDEATQEHENLNIDSGNLLTIENSEIENFYATPMTYGYGDMVDDAFSDDWTFEDSREKGHVGGYGDFVLKLKESGSACVQDVEVAPGETTCPEKLAQSDYDNECLCGGRKISRGDDYDDKLYCCNGVLSKSCFKDNPNQPTLEDFDATLFFKGSEVGKFSAGEKVSDENDVTCSDGDDCQWTLNEGDDFGRLKQGDNTFRAWVANLADPKAFATATLRITGTGIIKFDECGTTMFDRHRYIMGCGKYTTIPPKSTPAGLEINCLWEYAEQKGVNRETYKLCDVNFQEEGLIISSDCKKFTYAEDHASTDGGNCDNNMMNCPTIIDGDDIGCHCEKTIIDLEEEGFETYKLDGKKAYCCQGKFYTKDEFEKAASPDLTFCRQAPNIETGTRDEDVALPQIGDSCEEPDTRLLHANECFKCMSGDNRWDKVGGECSCTGPSEIKYVDGTCVSCTETQNPDNPFLWLDCEGPGTVGAQRGDVCGEEPGYNLQEYGTSSKKPGSYYCGEKDYNRRISFYVTSQDPDPEDTIIEYKRCSKTCAVCDAGKCTEDRGGLTEGNECGAGNTCGADAPVCCQLVGEMFKTCQTTELTIKKGCEVIDNEHGYSEDVSGKLPDCKENLVAEGHLWQDAIGKDCMCGDFQLSVEWADEVNRDIRYCCYNDRFSASDCGTAPVVPPEEPTEEPDTIIDSCEEIRSCTDYIKADLDGLRAPTGKIGTADWKRNCDKNVCGYINGHMCTHVPLEMGDQCIISDADNFCIADNKKNTPDAVVGTYKWIPNPGSFSGGWCYKCYGMSNIRLTGWDIASAGECKCDSTKPEKAIWRNNGEECSKCSDLKIPGQDPWIEVANSECGCHKNDDGGPGDGASIAGFYNGQHYYYNNKCFYCNNDKWEELDKTECNVPLCNIPNFAIFPGDKVCTLGDGYPGGDDMYVYCNDGTPEYKDCPNGCQVGDIEFDCKCMDNCVCGPDDIIGVKVSRDAGEIVWVEDQGCLECQDDGNWILAAESCKCTKPNNNPGGYRWLTSTEGSECQVCTLIDGKADYKPQDTVHECDNVCHSNNLPTSTLPDPPEYVKINKGFVYKNNCYVCQEDGSFKENLGGCPETHCLAPDDSDNIYYENEYYCYPGRVFRQYTQCVKTDGELSNSDPPTPCIESCKAGKSYKDMTCCSADGGCT